MHSEGNTVDSWVSVSRDAVLYQNGQTYHHMLPGSHIILFYTELNCQKFHWHHLQIKYSWGVDMSIKHNRCVDICWFTACWWARLDKPIQSASLVHISWLTLGQTELLTFFFFLDCQDCSSRLVCFSKRVWFQPALRNHLVEYAICYSGSNFLTYTQHTHTHTQQLRTHWRVRQQYLSFFFVHRLFLVPHFMKLSLKLLRNAAELLEQALSGVHVLLQCDWQAAGTADGLCWWSVESTEFTVWDTCCWNAWKCRHWWVSRFDNLWMNSCCSLAHWMFLGILHLDWWHDLRVRRAIKNFSAWPSSVQNKIKIVFASYTTKAQNTTCTIWLWAINILCILTLIGCLH